MKHVRRRVRFERGVAALPLPAEPAGHALEIGLRLGMLQVRREQAKSSLQHRWRAGDTSLSEKRRRNAALRRKPRVQKL